MPKETILVVDDERLVRWSLQQKLEQWGYHVSLAEDGATALGRIQLDNPDLITLDVKLPDMTGIEVLAELRNRNIQIPVIVITAFGIVDDAVRSLKLGAYDFIEKPINFEKLENAVHNALETRRLRTEVERTQELQRSEFPSGDLLAPFNDSDRGAPVLDPLELAELKAKHPSQAERLGGVLRYWSGEEWSRGAVLDAFGIEKDGRGNIRASTEEGGYATNVPGVFAAGDVRSKPYRQITTAVADGTVAAITAVKELEAMAG